MSEHFYPFQDRMKLLISLFLLQCEENDNTKSNNSDGPAAWAVSFEKLLEDHLGLHTFAVRNLTLIVTLEKFTYSLYLGIFEETI